MAETNVEKTSINYLSNLFSKFLFRNKNNNSVVNAETNDYFDTLELIGDDWIEFEGQVNSEASTNRTVNIKHKTISTSNSDYIDEAGHVINPSGLKLYIIDKGAGNIIFSYEKPNESEE